MSFFSEANNNAKSIIENTNLFLSSLNIWTLVVILVCVTLIFIYVQYTKMTKLENAVPMKKIDQQMKNYISQSTNQSTDQSLKENKEEIKIPLQQYTNYYDQISKYQHSDKIAHLKLYEKEAKRIIPNFPKFPTEEKLKELNSKKNLSNQDYIREYMQILFPGVEFNNIDPKWLNNMPLYCYSEELMIAVEYHNEYHYIWPNSKRGSKREFEKQLENEREKERICRNFNICYITISYLVPQNEIPFAIYCKLLDAIPYLNVNIRKCE